MPTQQDLDEAGKSLKDKKPPSDSEIIACEWCGRERHMDQLEFVAGSMHCKEGCPYIKDPDKQYEEWKERQAFDE